MVGFERFAVPSLGPPVADYASMLANIGTSFENAYARSRERTQEDYARDMARKQAAALSTTAPGGFALPGATATPGTAAPTGAGGSATTLPSFAKIEGGAPSADISGLITSTAATHQLDPGYLTRLVMIESKGNPNARNAGSGAAGLGQFIPNTWRQYGGGASPFDPGANLDATARLTKDNANALRAALGREPTQGELYLAHQQGAPGAIKLLTNPDARAIDVTRPANVLSNLPGALRSQAGSMTAGQFASLWTSRFPGGATAGAPPAPPARPTESAVSTPPAAAAAPGTIPPPSAPPPEQIERWKIIAANPNTPAPQKEDALANLARYAPAEITGAIPPGAATAPAAAPAAPPPPGGSPLPSMAAGGPAMTLPPAAQGSPPAAMAPPAATTPAPPPPPPPATAAGPPAAPPPAAGPTGQGVPGYGGQPRLDPEYIAALSWNPKTAPLAAQLIGNQLARENKPITQEVGGVIYQYDPNNGRWLPVAGQAKAPESIEQYGRRYVWDGKQYVPLSAGPGDTTGGKPFEILQPGDPRRQGFGIGKDDTRPYKIDWTKGGNPEPMSVDPTQFERETKQRDHFDSQQQNKEFYTVRDQFARGKQAIEDPSGAGDLTMVFSLMKMLDPNSTVREGEQASAANVGGAAQRFIGQYNQLLEGKGALTPQVRRDLFNQMQRIMVAQGSQYNARVDREHQIAKSYGSNPDNIASKIELPDLKAPLPSGAPKPAPAYQGPGGAVIEPGAAPPSSVSPITGRPTGAFGARPAQPGPAISQPSPQSVPPPPSQAAPPPPPPPGRPGSAPHMPVPADSEAGGDSLPVGTYYRLPNGKIYQSDGSKQRGGGGG